MSKLERFIESIDDTRITKISHKSYVEEADQMSVGLAIDGDDGEATTTYTDKRPHPEFLSAFRALAAPFVAWCELKTRGDSSAQDLHVTKELKCRYEGHSIEQVQLKVERLLENSDHSVTWKSPWMDRSDLHDGDIALIEDAQEEARSFVVGKRGQKAMFEAGVPEEAEDTEKGPQDEEAEEEFDQTPDGTKRAGGTVEGEEPPNEHPAGDTATQEPVPAEE